MLQRWLLLLEWALVFAAGVAVVRFSGPCPCRCDCPRVCEVKACCPPSCPQKEK